MSSTKYMTYYGMSSVTADEFYSTTVITSDLFELKRVEIAMTKNTCATVIMHVQRYDYGEQLINKRAMCTISFYYTGRDSVHYCGTLKAAEKTFHAMQKALEKQCLK